MHLDEQLIRQYLIQQKFGEQVEVVVLKQVDSTNRYLKTYTNEADVVICCSESQTQGRGRFQRSWYSPEGENIYCSFRWHFSDLKAVSSALSLVVSLAVANTLQTFGISEDIHIKWPNDVLWKAQKLSGILLETTPHPTQGVYVIIGIGLNVNSDTQAHINTTLKPWCSLYDITARVWDRNELLGQLFIQLHQYLTLFNQQGFPHFLAQWHTLDYLKGKTIEIEQRNQIIQGISQGVNDLGELLILGPDDYLYSIASGEATVKFSAG